METKDIISPAFNDEINSELEGRYGKRKSPERIKQAKAMRKIYFNSINLDGNDTFEPMEVVCIARHDNECALL